MIDPTQETWKRTSVSLPQQTVKHLERLRREWGLSHRGAVLERLLQQVFGDEDSESGSDVLPHDLKTVADRLDDEGELDEQLALVLIGRGALELLADGDESLEGSVQPANRSGAGGIDLPGFVRSRTSKLKRDLDPSRRPLVPLHVAPLQVSAELVLTALQEARDHWITVYGSSPNATVLENAMIWLANDIWPQCDQSEGRVFTWSAACEVMQDLVPSWPVADPSFELVMVTAGVLEDPYSPSTLTLRLPTLIRRFVHRFRRRQRGSSFQTLEHTMTLQGALKLLRLPTDPGLRLSLSQIRESYREMALAHHPDAGGSAEAMRRVNEAYQLLKELYRNRREANK